MTAIHPRWIQIGVGLIYLVMVTAAWADAVELEKFQTINVQGNATIELFDGERSSVAVSHLRSKVLIEVVDDVLYIDARDVAVEDDVVIKVTLGENNIKEILLDGFGAVVAQTLQTPTLVLEGMGAGTFDIRNLDVHELIVVGMGDTQFKLRGRADHQSIDLAGNGRYAGAALRSSLSQVSVKGQGDVSLWADYLIDINVFGRARVNYAGTARVHRRISGLGQVNRLPNFGTTAL